MKKENEKKKENKIKIHVLFPPLTILLTSSQFKLMKWK